MGKYTARGSEVPKNHRRIAGRIVAGCIRTPARCNVRAQARLAISFFLSCEKGWFQCLTKLDSPGAIPQSTGALKRDEVNSSNNFNVDQQVVTPSAGSEDAKEGMNTDE